MHDALEVAQRACELRPKDAEAWWTLGCVSRYTGMPAASEDAFRRAAELGRHRPFRVSPERFRTLVEEEVATLPATHRPRVAVENLPTADDVRAGLNPDAAARAREDSIILYQLNHENQAASESALRRAISASLKTPE